MVVRSSAALARVLGVSLPAVSKAEREGRISRRRDGWWDVFDALRAWRRNTLGTLQRPQRGSVFRPWLDPETPLTEVIRFEVARRARLEGAEEVQNHEEDDLDGDENVELDDDYDEDDDG